MVMPIFLLLCIRKEHVDSKVYKYEGIRIRVIFENALVKREEEGRKYERKENYHWLHRYSLHWFWRLLQDY